MGGVAVRVVRMAGPVSPPYKPTAVTPGSGNEIQKPNAREAAKLFFYFYYDVLKVKKKLRGLPRIRFLYLVARDLISAQPSTSRPPDAGVGPHGVTVLELMGGDKDHFTKTTS